MEKPPRKNLKKNTSKSSSNMYRARSYENVSASSVANSRLWETRLGAVEASRKEYRISAHRLASQNEDLGNMLAKSERDTIDVIKFLKEKMAEHEKSLQDEKENNRSLKKTNRQEIEKIVGDFTKKIELLDKKLEEKNHEISVLKDELKFAQEFRRNRRQMLSEIAELKKTLDLSNKSHQLEFSKLEQKLIVEKCRLEKDTKTKLTELTEKTHKEAISNLDEATKTVFRDNIRLKETLSIEISENERLRKANAILLEEKKSLSQEKEINSLTLKNQISKTKQDQEKLLTTKNKVEVLENSLNHIVREFEAEKEKLETTSGTKVLSVKDELERLQRVIELKTKEMSKIKKLAKTILEQRTEVECFFMEALDHVRMEIANTKTSWKSRGCVSMSALEETETLNNIRRVKGQIDISDLTWLQKERVLRLLFAKMNGYSRYTRVKPPGATGGQQMALLVSENEGSFPDMRTFLTET